MADPRQRASERKLAVAEQATRVVLELRQHTQSLGVEWHIVVLILAQIVCALSAACSKPAREKEAIDDPCASFVTPLPEPIQRGMSLAHSYQDGGSRGYGTTTGAATLRELRELGVGWVSLTPFGFMRSLVDGEVHSIGDLRSGETDARMHQEIRQAKALGLQVMLKPHIWVVRGQWRGKIELPDAAAWTHWFDSYQRWILHYAELAESEDVDILVIGVELRSTERRQENRWRALVSKVRQRFHGEITYGANWDDAAAVPWWDAVDYIGVQFYPPVATSETASQREIDAQVAARLDGIEAISRRFDKPVLLTEVGYRAASDALIHPHEWPERNVGSRFDPRVQAAGYQTLIEAVRTRPWVRGIYWWKWFTDPNTTEEGPTGFSPRGKLAEAILRAAYGGRCAIRNRSSGPN